MDFGFLPFDCRLESAYGYMTMIFGILWNACWSYADIAKNMFAIREKEKNNRIGKINKKGSRFNFSSATILMCFGFE